MKNLFSLFLVCACALFLAACSSSKKENRTLYIEEGEYESQIEQEAQSERRAAPPVVESNYIFRVLPKETFYYDEKNMPLDDGLKSVSDYKESRLWKRPKRYMPGTYPGATDTDSGTRYNEYDVE
ncbi:hypothetical protein AAIR98_000572 [Elusimicrobium simillimum]|uniref:hypothetical protein n=1 Tax=Elusimicrobium simillimum TaxID=3143438 RepID=UPI003C6F9EA7